MRTLIGLAAGGFAAAAAAQPGTAIRFDNGLSEITVAPGASVPVSIYAVNLPQLGTPIPWGTHTGTGQIGFYAGFLSVLMNLNGISSGSASWSGLTTPPPFLGAPFGSPGTPAGASVVGINSGVGFGDPVVGTEILLWQGTLTVGNADVSLATAIQAVGNPPLTGFEVALELGLPVLISQFISASNGSAVVHVPAPAGSTLLGIGVLAAARRRRTVARKEAR